MQLGSDWHTGKVPSAIWVDAIWSGPWPCWSKGIQIFLQLIHALILMYLCIQNCINHFTTLAKSKQCRFIGNVCLGRDMTLAQLRPYYHGLVMVSFIARVVQSLSFGWVHTSCLYVTNPYRYKYSLKIVITAGYLSSPVQACHVLPETTSCRWGILEGQGMNINVIELCGPL